MGTAKQHLLTPGPTPVPPDVALAMAQPMIHHRTPAYQEVFGAAQEGLRTVFQTAQPVLTLTASGTGAMEAAVANLAAPGEQVVVVESGKFGERWTALCRTYGVEPVVIRVPYGQAVEPAAVREALREHPKARTVYATHCETSTGVLHDIRALGEVVAPTDAVLVVDAISGLGADELAMDAWQIDVVVSGSQKGLMLPPGLAFIALSAKAWSRVEGARQPRYYFDLRGYRKSLDKGDTPFTPAVSLVIGLREALRRILAEGLPAVLARHAMLATATRTGVRALDLELFAARPANVLTAVRVPAGVDGKRLVAYLRDTLGVVVAGGQGEMAGQIFRIAHLGYMYEFDVVTGLSAVEVGLRQQGYACSAGAGVGAALAACHAAPTKRVVSHA